MIVVLENQKIKLTQKSERYSEIRKIWKKCRWILKWITIEKKLIRIPLRPLNQAYFSTIFFVIFLKFKPKVKPNNFLLSKISNRWQMVLGWLHWIDFRHRFVVVGIYILRIYNHRQRCIWCLEMNERDKFKQLNLENQSFIAKYLRFVTRSIRLMWIRMLHWILFMLS